MPEPVQPPAPLSPHDAAMVAKVDGATASLQTGAEPAASPAATPAPAARPENIPEKFWDAAKGAVKTEELLKSYAELEKARPAAAPAPAADPAKPPVAPPAAPGPVDLTPFSAEFAQKGELSAESYTTLEAAGYPKALVDSYIAGQKAQSAALANEAYSLAGGQEQYKAMASWALQNLPAAEQAAYDAAVSSGDPAVTKQAIVALKARFTDANGSDPTLISGSGQGGGEGAFGSRAEVVAAMSDPRYKKDPAYRAMVSRRVDQMQSF